MLSQLISFTLYCRMSKPSSPVRKYLNIIKRSIYIERVTLHLKKCFLANRWEESHRLVPHHNKAQAPRQDTRRKE